MNRQFAVPVAIALSFHAFLFLGFTRDPSLDIGIKKPTTRKPAERPIELQASPPRDESNDSNEPAPRSPRPAVVVPTLPEPPLTRVVTDLITTRVPPTVPTDLPHTITTIPSDNYPGQQITDGNGHGPVLFDPSKLDNPPRTKFQISPQYPYTLKAAGVTGEVLVEFTVNEEGSVTNPHVVSSSRAEFEEPTLRAVRQWKFEPGKREGRTVRFRMSVPIVFSLNAGE